MADFDFVNQFAKKLADALRDRIVEQVTAQLTGANAVRKIKTNGVTGVRKLKRDMSCRVAGCRNRSKGPAFRYICEEHLKKLSKVEQRKAIEQWKTRKAA